MHSQWNPSYLPARPASVPFFAKREIPGQFRPSSPLSENPYRSAPAPAPVPATDTLPRDISMRFGERLRDLRKARNMTQLRMAVDFGIDRSFISDVECGKKSISLALLEVIALGMEIQLSDLLRGL